MEKKNELSKWFESLSFKQKMALHNATDNSDFFSGKGESGIYVGRSRPKKKR